MGVAGFRKAEENFQPPMSASRGGRKRRGAPAAPRWRRRGKTRLGLLEPPSTTELDLRETGLPRCCAIAVIGDFAALLSSSGLEQCGCAGLCHSALRVRLPRDGRPSGLHHELGLVV